ncbi:MAG: isocitrate/isopropylmalate family dehydrogenase [Myxococcota bacterium]
MKITVAKGDGIGLEVMDAVLRIFEKAGVPLEYEHVEMGERVALSGDRTGISPGAKTSVESTGILFKGPMATPKGGGYKSVNVTARKMWGTFANKRVYRVLPGVETPLKSDGLELTMVRENIEDTYGGIEHMQTYDVAQCRRLISRPGCEQVHRYTFEMAKREGHKRVTCGHKANIMKLTDGLFLSTFYEIAKDYPELEADDVIIDAMAMRLVYRPTDFDVIVMPNLQGDILTDLAAGLVGGLAYAPSANLGDSISIFEAVHGTAPDIAGQDLANPTALLLSGTMMLNHLGLTEHATLIEDAVGKTLTRMHAPSESGEPPPAFRTSKFVEEMIETLSSMELPKVEAPKSTDFTPRSEMVMRVSPAPKETVINGVDIFLESGLAPSAVAEQLQTLNSDSLKLIMISNRGTQVWPTGSPLTDGVDHHRCRFEGTAVTQSAICRLLEACSEMFPICGAEWLRTHDGVRGYSLAQGQG